MDEDDHDDAAQNYAQPLQYAAAKPEDLVEEEDDSAKTLHNEEEDMLNHPIRRDIRRPPTRSGSLPGYTTGKSLAHKPEL
ncbi:hypothetical protein BGZ73_004671 [Actinomortierella ambigua]|nr:hypothetical protein BGZ73_004671 [Actinomortierella ambigua]